MHKEADLIVYADDTAIITGSRNIELMNNYQIALKRHKWLDKRKQASPQCKENKKQAL